MSPSAFACSCEDAMNSSPMDLAASVRGSSTPATGKGTGRRVGVANFQLVPFAKIRDDLLRLAFRRTPLFTKMQISEARAPGGAAGPSRTSPPRARVPSRRRGRPHRPSARTRRPPRRTRRSSSRHGTRRRRTGSSQDVAAVLRMGDLGVEATAYRRRSACSTAAWGALSEAATVREPRRRRLHVISVARPNALGRARPANRRLPGSVTVTVAGPYSRPAAGRTSPPSGPSVRLHP